MKPFSQVATLLTVLALHSTKAADLNLPAVKETFTHMNAGRFEGKPLNAIIPPRSIKLIALTGNGGKGAPLTPGFTPQWDSNEFMKRLFLSDAQLQQLSLSAYEGTFAEYSIVTHEGSLFTLQVVGNFLSKTAITAS